MGTPVPLACCTLATPLFQFQYIKATISKNSAYVILKCRDPEVTSPPGKYGLVKTKSHLSIGFLSKIINLALGST